MKRFATLVLVFLVPVISALAGGCRPAMDERGNDEALNEIASEYLHLALAMGAHDANHVDAYFGPEEIQEEVEANPLGLDEIETRAAGLKERLQEIDPSDEMETLRHRGLGKRLLALTTRAEMARGERFPFDEETRRLYDAVAPDNGAERFQAVLDRIDELLPGEGTTSARVKAFRQRFVIPVDRLEDVFQAAIDECRRRTLERLELPEGESFTVEYVNDKPWSGYNWYKGGAYSLIQVNTDLPIFIDRAVDLGCHEGYPGHHTYNALLEKSLVEGRGWLEFTVYPLFSPASLIAEGSANYGIDLAFPGSERTAFEKEALFPLAGLDASEADRYYELLDLLGQLSYAGNEAARDYLDGAIQRDEAANWLSTYSLMSPERADQRVDFIETYRGYVVNYNLGKDMVRRYVEREGGDGDVGDAAAARWARFSTLLSSPLGPSDLAE